MSYQLIACFQLIYIIPSILLYVIEFCFIFNSKDVEYSSAFYYIFLFRAPVDLLQVIVRFITFRFPLTSWLNGTEKLYMVKIGFIIGADYLILLELSFHLILSTNRFTAISYPLKNNHWWTPRNIIKILVVCFMIALIEPITRLPQEFAYTEVDGVIVPYATDRSCQKRHFYISSCFYMFFCITTLMLNAASLNKHSQQRKTQLFDVRQTLARAVQLNLLVYSSSFTVAIIAMTILQGMMSSEAFPRETRQEAFVVIMLSLTRDIIALLNPWLLLILSKSFRSRFLKALRSAALQPSTLAFLRVTEKKRRSRVFSLPY